MRKKKLYLVVISILIVNIILFIVGLRYNDNFLEISLSGILSLDLTALVSVFLVQALADQRRKYDFLVKLLDNVIKELADEDLVNHNKHVRASLLQQSIYMFPKLVLLTLWWI